MRHIEQHILELFVLGSDRVMERRAEIEAHLAECHGCRTLVEQMEGSYRAVEARFRNLEENSASGSLERVHPKPAPRYEGVAAAVRDYRPLTRVQRMRALVRRHPVIAGSGAFGVMALLAALLWTPNRLFQAEANPQVVRANPATGLLEVYTGNHEILWSLPAGGLPAVEDYLNRGMRFFGTIDLDGDGRNEVVTTVHIAGVGDPQAPPVAVFSADKQLKHAWLYTQDVTYDGRLYSAPLGSRFLVTGDFAGDGSQQVVAKVDGGRSPNALVRYSASGEILGEYWHYGAIHALYAADVDGDGRPEVIIGGQNDVGEKEGERFAFLAVLHPDRIVGRTESQCSRGFGHSASSSEGMYIRFPVSDMNTALGAAGFVSRVEASPDRVTRTVSVLGGGDATDVLEFHYVFAGDFSCVEVKSTDGTTRLHDTLARQRKVRGTVDSTYLENLRAGVRFFDGREWKSELVTMGRHTPPVP